MSVQEELLSIERQLWSGGAGAYHEHLDDHCLVAFTEMAGVMTREQVAGTVEGGPRWRDVEIDVEGVLEPTSDTAFLTYRARARRGESESYRAVVSSGYVRRDGAWKLMLHQQTPLAEAASR
jgi:hypothetical protein